MMFQRPLLALKVKSNPTHMFEQYAAGRRGNQMPALFRPQGTVDASPTAKAQPILGLLALH